MLICQFSFCYLCQFSPPWPKKKIRGQKEKKNSVIFYFYYRSLLLIVIATNVRAFGSLLFRIRARNSLRSWLLIKATYRLIGFSYYNQLIKHFAPNDQQVFMLHLQSVFSALNSQTISKLLKKKMNYFCQFSSPWMEIKIIAAFL